MKEKFTLIEVLQYAAKQLRDASIRNAVVDISTATTTAYLTVRRSFAIEGSINISFSWSAVRKGFAPTVNVNFPACNKDVMQAAAFAGLVNELVPLAASLQVELDALKIVEEK
jgi:hypothetical protein